MRLFVAVVPPSAVLDHLAAAVARLQSEQVAADPRIRWTVRAQWHLTLAFLGDVDDAVRPELHRRLARAAARHPVLRLRVGGGGAFGSARKARVLWAGVGGDATPLRDLARSVGAAARRTGIEVSEGRFRAHLTLARLREPLDVRALVEWLSSYEGPTWSADQVELVCSHLGQGEGRRSRYETVESWPLDARHRRAE
jgi:RNA 2',3'-cyclic 3'-phosphodiesterase